MIHIANYDSFFSKKFDMIIMYTNTQQESIIWLIWSFITRRREITSVASISSYSMYNMCIYSSGITCSTMLKHLSIVLLP